MQRYSKPKTKSSPISGGIDGPVERVDVLPEILGIVRDARVVGSRELVRWAEQLKNAELCILRGEPVPAAEVATLQQRVTAFTPQAEPAVAEVHGA
jgi:hypothetical protein